MIWIHFAWDLYFVNWKQLVWSVALYVIFHLFVAWKLLITLRMKSYSKTLDVDGVNTPCKFFAEIEMYVLRDAIKNKRCYLKKITDLVTEWRRNCRFSFFSCCGKWWNRVSVATSDGKCVVISVANADEFLFCCSLPCLFIPAKSSPVAVSIAISVANGYEIS